jgi:hypothetical protein
MEKKDCGEGLKPYEQADNGYDSLFRKKNRCFKKVVGIYEQKNITGR